MSNLLLVALIAADLLLVGLVMISLRRKTSSTNGIEVLKELDQEHRILKDLQDSVRDDLDRKYSEMKSLYEKVSAIATEADVELRSGSAFMEKEVSHALEQARKELDGPLDVIARQRNQLSSLIQKSQQERLVLKKAIARAEKLARFFDGRVPYEEVLEEITDKKYTDARFLLSKGMAPAEVATEIGLPESEVQLIASMR